MAKSPDNSKAFLVQIFDTQNSTWQGTITWTDSQEVSPFRSALELIKLIDSALDTEK